MNRNLTGIVKKAVVGCIAAAALAMVIPSTVRAEEKRILEKEYADCQRLDVTSYGADKTGAGDSSQAFASAVADAEKLHGTGQKAVIYVPSGKYNLNTNITIKTGTITIVSEDDTVIQSSRAVILRASGTAYIKGGTWENKGDNTLPENSMFWAGEGSNLHISDAVCKNSYRAVYSKSATVTMQNVTVSGASYAGISTSNCVLVIENSTYTDCKIGVMVTASSTATLNNITVQNCKDVGLEAVSKSKMTINESIVTDNGLGYSPKNKKNFRGHGIGSYSNATVYVNGTTVEKNNQCGISLSKGNVVVDNCYIANNGRQGIGTEKKCTVTVKNSTIHHNGYNTKELKKGHNGIVIQDGSKGVVENCTISNSKNTGIWVNGKGSSLKIKNSLLKGNKLFPISVESSSGKTTLVSENCTYKNSKHGARIQGECKFKKKGKNKFINTGKEKFVF